MIIPIELFSLFIGLVMIFTVIGFWKKAPVFILVGGIMLFYLTMTTDSITMDAFASGTTDNIFHMNVESRSGTNQMNAGGNIAFAEFIGDSSSVLIGKEINCIDLYLGKIGTPPSTYTVGIMDNSAVPNMFLIFDTHNANSLSTSSMWITSCLSGDNTYILKQNDRIGSIYNAGDITNAIFANGDSTNPFDSTHTFSSFNNGITWTSQTTTDRTMRLYLSDGFQITDNPFIFGNEIKILFALFSSLVCLMGVLLFKFKD